MFITIKRDLGGDYVKCVASGIVGINDSACSRNTAMYLFTCMQYLTCCLCFSISKPFRKPIYTNPLFLISVAIMGVYQTYMLLFANDTNKDLFHLVDIPESYRTKLFSLFILNTVVSYTFEKYLIGWYSSYYTQRQEKMKIDRYV